jgi:molecular chaperone GrpE
MTDEIQKNIHAVVEEPVLHGDCSLDKEISGSQASDEKISDMASVWKDRYVRLLADLENTKKRLARDSGQEVGRQKEKILKDVLLFADGLDLSLIHLTGKNDNRNILQGIELLQNILDKFFFDHDVTIITALGEVFDPNIHEAIGMVQHPAAAPNTVARVEKKGYLYRGKLLRPAQVLVAGS